MNILTTFQINVIQIAAVKIIAVRLSRTAAFPVVPECQDLQDHKASRGLPGRRENRGLPVSRVSQALQDHRVNQDLPGRRDNRGLPVSRVNRALSDLRANRDLPGHRANRALPGHRANQASQDLRANRDLPGHKANRDLPGRRVSRGLPGRRGLQLRPSPSPTPTNILRAFRLVPTVQGRRPRLLMQALAAITGIFPYWTLGNGPPVLSQSVQVNPTLLPLSCRMMVRYAIFTAYLPTVRNYIWRKALSYGHLCAWP